MSLNREDTVKALNHLISICKNSEEAYDQVGDDLDDQHYKTLFKEYVTQRIQFISQLQNEIQLLGELPGEHNATLAGELNQVWMSLKAVLTSGNTGALLAELERVEDVVVGAYQGALEKELPTNTRQVLEDQFNQIKMAHDRIKAMRDAVQNR
jgi:uncharacterized protein (TIGR02284 family)